ncbi:hypothetical protein ALC56_11911 [Trachymyrmex septentrionalis]|uniref:NADH:ubiquinone reductase (H(+)-translocating) n=1 Tax=Trachymyrmex septentrionalis TaxID=34720 RepID=A0A151JTH6_9HYME|nr:hypothetical protein ALC56_11911 [Trachymyrmex septentrionalis]
MFHVRLPKAPVYGSIILAGVLLEMGNYGLIRFMEEFYVIKVKWYIKEDKLINLSIIIIILRIIIGSILNWVFYYDCYMNFYLFLILW